MLEGATVLWQPHPGPQTTFLASTAYEVLYGGQVGGGKSDCLVNGSLRQIEHPHYKALILRRTFPELRELMDRALAIFPALGGNWNEQAKRYTWPSGAHTEFGYCEKYSDVLQFQGKQYTYIGFDELGQIAQERIWTYLMTRNRTAHPNLQLQMRASANPGGAGHHWLKRRFIDMCSPDGTPIQTAFGTRAFVRATIYDNPTLVQNDPLYLERLKNLPELEYRWLALGDWTAGGGLAFPELGTKERYMVAPFQIPIYWKLFGSFDWGYQHPFSFGIFAVDEDGTLYLVDSVHGRHLQPPEIAERVKRSLANQNLTGRLRYVFAGHDCWVKARGDHIPTLAEEFLGEGFVFAKANIARVAGVQNMRRYLRPDDRTDQPRFKLFDTPMNRRTFEVLEGRIADPEDVEDVLKTDADESGVGGDDPYDMVRYGLAARPLKARLPVKSNGAELPHHDPMVILRDLKTIDGHAPRWIGPEHPDHDTGDVHGYAEFLPANI
jgi:hypothetical protein